MKNQTIKTMGKIAQLPSEIRDQLHERMQINEKPSSLLQWLNGLPEVQTLTAARFDGIPITKQNLSEYKKYSFRHWQLQQDALRFIQNARSDDAALQKAADGQLSGVLSRWAATRYATVAQAIASTSSDPQTELHHLGILSSHITALRRGDLNAERIGIEQQRLDLDRARKQEELEAIFWDWTKRPDIKAVLCPYRDPDKIRRDVERMVNHKLLGIPLHHEPDIPDDPACLI